MPKILSSWTPLVAHVVLALVGLAWLGLAPSTPGNLLLVPLTTEAGQRIPGLAVARGGLLLRQGPWDGSLVVKAEDHWSLGTLLGAAILPLAAPEWLCGVANKGERA